MHGDGIRNITGTLVFRQLNSAGQILLTSAGAFATASGTYGALDNLAVSGASTQRSVTTFTPSAVVPVAAKNQPRAFGVLACVYLGKPAA